MRWKLFLLYWPSVSCPTITGGFSSQRDSIRRRQWWQLWSWWPFCITEQGMVFFAVTLIRPISWWCSQMTLRLYCPRTFASASFAYPIRITKSLKWQYRQFDDSCHFNTISFSVIYYQESAQVMLTRDTVECSRTSSINQIFELLVKNNGPLSNILIWTWPDGGVI